MIILHAGILQQRFLLWAEAPIPGLASAKPRAPYPTKRLKKATYPSAYPYDAGVKRLFHALQNDVPDLVLNPESICQVLAWIPTQDNLPLPSIPLIAHVPLSAGKVCLRPWQIEAYSLSECPTLKRFCQAYAGRGPEPIRYPD